VAVLPLARASTEQSCIDNWFRSRDWPRDCEIVCLGGRRSVLTARSEAELAATAADITTAGGRAAFVSADLGLVNDCGQLRKRLKKNSGRVDILVNNAGHYGPVLPVEEYPLEEFERVIGRALTRGILAEPACASRNVCTKKWRDSEYFEHFGEGRVTDGARHMRRQKLECLD